MSWSTSEGDFNLVLRIILFETVALNLFIPICSTRSNGWYILLDRGLGTDEK